jgi:hypothetical protein
LRQFKKICIRVWNCDGVLLCMELAVGVGPLLTSPAYVCIVLSLTILPLGPTIAWKSESIFCRFSCHKAWVDVPLCCEPSHRKIWFAFHTHSHGLSKDLPPVPAERDHYYCVLPSSLVVYLLSGDMEIQMFILIKRDFSNSIISRQYIQKCLHRTLYNKMHMSHNTK